MSRMRPGSTTEDYRNATSGEGAFGSLGYEWSDKPHRLVYDLCGEVDRLREMERHWRELYFQAWEVPEDNQTAVGDPSKAVLDPIYKRGYAQGYKDKEEQFDRALANKGWDPGRNR